MTIKRSVMGWMRQGWGKSTDEIVRNLKYLHVERVELKVTDGNWTMNTPLWGTYQGEMNMVRELARSIREAGIDVFGWGFSYGDDPQGELGAALLAIEKLELVGWVWDAEVKFCYKKNAPEIAGTLTRGMKAEYPAIVQAWCSWPWIYNPNNKGAMLWNDSIWRAVAPYCDEGMPMTYWQTKDLAAACAFVGTSIDQWKKFGSWEIVPILRGYNDGKGIVKREWILPLLAYITTSGAAGASWWSLDRILAWPQLYRAIAEANSDLEP